MQVTKQLNCLSLLCPMPTVKTKIELEKLKPGEILLVKADDPAAEKDLPAWAASVNEEHIKTEKHDDILYIYLRKK